MKRLCFILGLFCCLGLAAAEVIPPAPARYFNDYAHVVSPATAQKLNQTLEDFEKQSSSQILVVVYPKMESDSSIEDYTVRVARAWRVGQKSKNNGAVLFVFVQDRKMFIQVGYGLEGALPDVTAKRIVEDEIKPRFAQGDFDGGLTAGVNAMIAATKGEYQGTCTTANSGNQNGPGIGTVVLWAFVALVLFSIFFGGRRRRSGLGWGGWMLGSGGFSGWGGGGGGGFSGGGGSFGGGGAGGSW